MARWWCHTAIISPWEIITTLFARQPLLGASSLTCYIIIGKPLVIYWSYDAPTDQLASPNIGLDHIVDVALHFFTKTRWKRTFMLIHGYPVE